MKGYFWIIMFPFDKYLAREQIRTYIKVLTDNTSKTKSKFFLMYLAPQFTVLLVFIFTDYIGFIFPFSLHTLLQLINTASKVSIKGSFECVIFSFPVFNWVSLLKDWESQRQTTASWHLNEALLDSCFLNIYKAHPRI